MEQLVKELQIVRQEITVIPAERHRGVATAEHRDKYREESEVIFLRLFKRVDEFLARIESTVAAIHRLRKEAQSEVNQAHLLLQETRQVAEELQQKFAAHCKEKELQLELEERRLQQLESSIALREQEVTAEQQRLSELSITDSQDFIARRMQLESLFASKEERLEEEYQDKLRDADNLRARLDDEYRIHHANLETGFKATFYERLENRLKEVTEQKTDKLNKLIADYENRSEQLRRRESYVVKKWSEISAQIAHLKLKVELENIYTV